MQFSSIVETENRFLNLWPHRHDYLYAKQVSPGERPEWHTADDNHYLHDRKILSGEQLIGVRFGKETQYLMLDIDRQSAFHPHNDRMAIGRILEALENIGLVSFVAVTSSYSSGVHLYFPFEHPITSWMLANAAAWFLECAGFKPAPGHLELFPNAHRFDLDGKFTLFNGHRLPLQVGSYLLNEDWQLVQTTPMGGSVEALRRRFVDEWVFCSARNDPDMKAIEWAAEKFKRRRRRSLSFKANKFLEDLNQEIEPGWTGHGQTNQILGRITLRAYVFGHVTQDLEKPITGDALVAEIVRTAVALPGYEQWCRHQGDIWRRAEEWARCAENSSHYYPYGGARKKLQAETSEPTYTTWNQWQERRAREKICFAIADQLNQESWPMGITERFNILTGYGVSGETLYRHADLWHPGYIGTFSTGESLSKGFPEGAGSGGAAPFGAGSNLLIEQGVNPASDETLRPFWSNWDFEQAVIPLSEGDRGDRPSDLLRDELSDGGISSA